MFILLPCTIATAPPVSLRSCRFIGANPFHDGAFVGRAPRTRLMGSRRCLRAP